MVVNDNVGSLIPRGVLGFIASELAPTVNSTYPPSHPASSDKDYAFTGFA
jgi:hypothetical protein